jgi:hypothetical protein
MQTKLLAGAAAVGLTLGGIGAATAATTSPPPKLATVKAIKHTEVKVNRYVKDEMRWQRDTYVVRSGGTVRIVNLAADEGPHTFTIVKKSDLPRTQKQILGSCHICEQLGAAHGADPNSDAPPKFTYLEDGVGSDDPPALNKPGDSSFIPPQRGYTLNLHVTAAKGTTLHFMCLIHPWMQGKINVR